jgi:hypothetical protein
VGGIGGAVGMAGGNVHSLVTTVEGRVLVFGGGEGCVGLGAEVRGSGTDCDRWDHHGRGRRRKGGKRVNTLACLSVWVG